MCDSLARSPKATFDDTASVPSPDFTLIFDCARAAIEFKNMRDIWRGLVSLVWAQESGEIEIMRCKNRFKMPTGGGWSDVLINFSFQSGPAQGHVCEIQVRESRGEVALSRS